MKLTLSACVLASLLLACLSSSAPPSPEEPGEVTARALSSGIAKDVAIIPSMTVEGKRLALMFVFQFHGNEPAIIYDQQRNWELVTRKFSGLRALSVYRFLSPETTQSSSTIRSPGNLIWSVVEYGNVDVSGTNGSGAIAQFGSEDHRSTGCSPGTVPLPNPGAPGSAVAAAFAMNESARGTITAGDGFSLIGSHAPGQLCTAQGCMQVEFSPTFVNPATMSWSNPFHCSGVAVEIRAASSTSPSPSTSTPGEESPTADAAPVADFTWSCDASLTCTFDGGASTDDNGITLYEWILNGSVRATGETFTRSFRRPMTFDLTLRVTDTANRTDAVTQSVSVH